MTDTELISALRRNMAETGSLICLGCGHEHNCGIHGCAILRAAADSIKSHRWIPTSERLPENPDEGVMVVASGQPCKNTTLVGAYEFATYSPSEGWILDEYPAWEHPVVSHWMPLPEPPKEGE